MTERYWFGVNYAHQGQEKPNQPDNSWDPYSAPINDGGVPWWNFDPVPVGGGWWGPGVLGGNLIPNPYAVPGVFTPGFGYDYTFPGLFDPDDVAAGWAERFSYSGDPAVDPDYRYVPLDSYDGWHLQVTDPLRDIREWTRHVYQGIYDWRSTSIGTTLASPSSVQFVMGGGGTETDPGWPSYFGGSGYPDDLFWRLFGVRRMHSTATEPGWILATPGQTYAAELSAVHPYASPSPWDDPAYWEMQRAAMGVEWFGPPTGVAGESPPKLGEDVGPVTLIESGVDSPSRPKFNTYSGSPLAVQDADIYKNNYFIRPRATFTAPPGAVYAKPFMQGWMDVQDLRYSDFYFGPVIT